MGLFVGWTLASLMLADVAAFDYLILAMIWPGSVCRFLSPCRVPPGQPQRFTVHGLWPQNFNGTYPQDCPGSRFDPSLLDDLRSRLDLRWTDYKGTAPTFWGHEWDKHGTCATSVKMLDGQSRYFNQTLTLVDRWDPTTALAKGGVVPDPTRRYPRGIFLDLLESLTKGRPRLVCDPDGILREIRLCLSKSLLPIDCPIKQRGCETIRFLPLEKSSTGQ